MYHNPVINNDINSLSVRVSGGELADREFLSDVIATSLNKSGFTGVRAVSTHGYPTMAEQHKPKSVLDQVTKLRPDLFKKEIVVVPEQTSNSPVTFSASTKNGTSFTIGGDVSVGEFIEKANDFGDVEKIAVSGKDQRSVLIAARNVLDTMPVSEITLKLEREPWMQPGAGWPPYYPPVSAMPPLNESQPEKATA